MLVKGPVTTLLCSKHYNDVQSNHYKDADLFGGSQWNWPLPQLINLATELRESTASGFLLFQRDLQDSSGGNKNSAQ